MEQLGAFAQGSSWFGFLQIEQPQLESGSSGTSSSTSNERNSRNKSDNNGTITSSSGSSKGSGSRTAVAAAPKGGVLRYLVALTSLRKLDLSNCVRVGVEGVQCVCEGMPWLEDLCLDGCKLTDAGMEAIGRMTRLRVLDISGSPITDAALVHLSQLNTGTYGSSATISSTSTSTSTPTTTTSTGTSSSSSSSITSTSTPSTITPPPPGLQELRMWRCPNLTSSGMEHIGQIRTLRRLDVSQCPVGNLGLAHLRPLSSSLSSLDLSWSGVSDEGLCQLAGYDWLEELHLSGPNVTPLGLRQVRGLPRLRKVRLWSVTSEVLAAARDVLLGVVVY
ncbi:hypothetical protein CLOM_g45 [Closterium sp. NIES-68]|nr:hypothetical protein CLOM_g45 [Closterium sp. NIES-68]